MVTYILRRYLLSLLLIGQPFPLAAQTAVRCPQASVADTSSLQAALASLTDPRSALYVVQPVCDQSRLVLAAGVAPGLDSQPDYGARVFVFRHSPDGRYTLISRSKGLMDSNVPDLNIYHVGPRFLVLADIGNEGSWGIETYELRSDSLIHLGILDIGLALDEFGPDASALDHTRPSLRAGRWEATVDTAVVMAPNQEPPHRRALPAAPRARFVQAEPVWRLIEDR